MTQFFDLMIDTETAGLPPCGALLSIGAVFFDLHTCTLGPTFLRTINLVSSVAHGGVMDPGTVLWWLRQGDDARKGVAYGGEPIDLVLSDFATWIAEQCRHEDVRPWGNSSSFDLTIINSAYRNLKMRTPWHFTNERCFRTVRNQYPGVAYEFEEKGDGAHNALVDAQFQAQHLFKIKNRLKGA
ncbi:3'-5' exonuclease [Comamonas antarctica]|uniref:3'-5' exonuclease n=1 Tax=Comamonas antarctica TaxID=2743470 RepID=UPI0028EDBF93|nr:3'-5' exonuclease [Comamonas antarctica]